MELIITCVSELSNDELAKYKKYVLNEARWHQESGYGSLIDLENAMYILDQIESRELLEADQQVENFMEHQANLRDHEYEIETMRGW